MFRSERVLRIICFEPVFLAFNPGGLSAKPYRTRVFFLHIFLPAHKKLIVLGHFSFQFELWFFLIWSWSIPVGASEIRCSTRVFAASKTAATDHSRHESAKCEQDSKSVSSFYRARGFESHRLRHRRKSGKTRFCQAFFIVWDRRMLYINPYPVLSALLLPKIFLIESQDERKYLP